MESHDTVEPTRLASRHPSFTRQGIQVGPSRPGHARSQITAFRVTVSEDEALSERGL